MSEEDPPEWDYIRTRNVGQDRKITMPPDLRSAFVMRDHSGDRAVLWYWLMSAGVALLTDDLLENGEYQRFGYRTYYDTDQFQFPAELIHELTYEVTEGDTAVFLAHEAMLTSDPKSVYVLNDRKALELIGRTDADDLASALKQQPAFFGPV